MKQSTFMQKFWMGFAISLVGAALIWAGDGSASLWRKGVVISGVMLVIGGLSLLRYLLFTNRKQINGR